MYRRSKKLAAVLMTLSFSAFSVIGSIPVSAAQVNLPNVAFVGIEHSPLVEGETESFTLTSMNYDGQVQYRVWLNKADTDEWIDITGGYTQPVDAKTPYEIKYNKPFELGSYKLVTWVKIAGTNGTKANRFGYGYDNLYEANLNTVDRDSTQRVYADGDLDISRDKYAVGEPVVVNGIKNINGISGPYSYKLHLFRPDKVTENQNGWVTDVTAYDTNGAKWTPSEQGSYVLDVWATAPSSKAKYESWKLKNITVEDATIYDQDGAVIGSDDSSISAIEASTQVASTEFMPLTVASKTSTIDKSINIMGKNITVKNVIINGNVYLTGNNATFKNVTVNGTIYVDPGKEGSSNFDTVTAKNMEVVSGAKEGIKFNNVKCDSLKTSQNDLVKTTNGTDNKNNNSTGTNNTGTTGTGGSTASSGGSGGGGSGSSSGGSSSGSNTSTYAQLTFPEVVTAGETKVLSAAQISTPVKINTAVSVGGQTVNVELGMQSVPAGATVTFNPIPAEVPVPTTGVFLPVNIVLTGFNSSDNFEVKLDLPSGLAASDVGAYHYNVGSGIWEYREAVVDGGKVVFTTNLSPIMLAQRTKAPSNIGAVVNGNTVTLSWDAQEGENQYYIYGDNGEKYGPTTGTSYTINPVAVGDHKYKVRRYKVNGNLKFESAATELVSKVTVVSSNNNTGNIAPSVPVSATNVRVTSEDTRTDQIGGVQNVVTWDASPTSGVTYDVLRARENSTASAIKVAADLTTLNYTDTLVTASLNYYYFVVTKNASGGIVVSDGVQVTTANDIQTVPSVVSSVQITTSSAFVIKIPASGSTTTSYIAMVKDQNGNIMSGEGVTWSLQTPTTGASIDATTGAMTVGNTTTASSINVVAASISNPSVTTTQAIILAPFYKVTTNSAVTLNISFEKPLYIAGVALVDFQDLMPLLNVTTTGASIHLASIRYATTGNSIIVGVSPSVTADSVINFGSDILEDSNGNKINLGGWRFDGVVWGRE